MPTHRELVLSADESGHRRNTCSENAFARLASTTA
ncbi:hypothetical protein QF048_007284 [Streptomyces sp. W4I9-2]|nr:hypothetical protein [Streptomyces sp. W4I9-2]